MYRAPVPRGTQDEERANAQHEGPQKDQQVARMQALTNPMQSPFIA